MGNLIRVHGVGQEYWFVSRQRCQCGGALQRLSQALVAGPRGPADHLLFACERCGRRHEFLFDVSGFFGKPDPLVSRVLSKIPDEKTRRNAWMAASSPVAAAVLTIFELVEERDELALAWIEDALAEARARLRDAGPPNGSVAGDE